MRSRVLRVAAALPAAFLLTIVSAVPASAAPLGPVVNGEFEIVAPGQDEVCLVTGDTHVDVLPPDQNPDPSLPWPWLVRVSPCGAGAFKALHWSSSNVTEFGDFDGDGDREARVDGSVESDPLLGNAHNFWQAFPSPHQAYTADFDALRFRVEGGSIPQGAYVQISLSQTPLDEQTPWLVIFIDCFLTFTGLAADASGEVSVDPTTASFQKAWSGCADTETAWNSAGPVARREILNRHRIVQVSFWGFQTGAPLLIDGVDLSNAKLAGAV